MGRGWEDSDDDGTDDVQGTEMRDDAGVPSEEYTGAGGLGAPIVTRPAGDTGERLSDSDSRDMTDTPAPDDGPPPRILSPSKSATCTRVYRCNILPTFAA